jgi:hypothetical protein
MTITLRVVSWIGMGMVVVGNLQDTREHNDGKFDLLLC